MDTNQKIQSSFIPKKPVSGGSFSKNSSGFFPFIADLIFIVALVASLLVFLYSKYLESSISKMENDLTAARTSLQPDLINQLYRSDLRIVSSKILVKNHVSVSYFFELLQAKTLQNVSFSSFAYNSDENGGISILMKGNAKNYTTLALQAKILEQDKSFINPVFSDLNLNEKGEVVFVFKSQLNPGVVSYVANMDNISKPVVPTMTNQSNLTSNPSVDKKSLDGGIGATTTSSNLNNQ